MNLRSDLAKLTDAELAARLEDAWDKYDTNEKRTLAGWVFSPIVRTRGPIRHPRAYRFMAALRGGSGSWLDLLFAGAMIGRKTEGFLRSDPGADRHLNICEIQDISDELERRIAINKKKKQ